MKDTSLISSRSRTVVMQRANGAARQSDSDYLAAEEPLEIRIEGHSVAVVMRTPGEDRELAAGFLVTEGLVHSVYEIIEIEHHPHCPLDAQKNGSLLNGTVRAEGENVVNVRLRQPESVDFKRLTRHVFSSSSCGICSRATIEAVRQQFPPIKDDFEIEPGMLFGLTAALTAVQETFQRTGGLHACGLFDAAGKLLVLREDVGRHNALDKVVGWALLNDRLPLRRHILLLSGRASFEMMQKSLAAGIPVVAAISAPSSLAVEFARECGQTLVGFLRGERMNVYTGAARLRQVPPICSRPLRDEKSG